MFQTFETTTDPETCGPRLEAVRALLHRHSLDAVLVPRTDAHQGEYVVPAAERLRWLTSFTGSAGLAIVTQHQACLLVDGRYTTQARGQTDPKHIEIVPISNTFEIEAQAWLNSHLRDGSTIGYDPWLHTIEQHDALKLSLGRHQHKLKATTSNLIDRVWGAERPSPTVTSIVVHDETYAGRSATEKIGSIQKELREAGDRALIVTLPDNIAWLFNIRGKDIPHNPVALAFAIVHAKAKPELFITSATLDRHARTHLAPIAKLRAPTELYERLKWIAKEGPRIRIDPKSAAHWFVRTIGTASRTVQRGPDPITAAKARKNETELAGARRAHLRDGQAMCKFLYWFDNAATAGQLDEITVARKLEEFRLQTGKLEDISFDTIAGSGPNGAIVHYRVTVVSNRKIRRGDLFLIDSGAQYRDGTTDVTRTIAVGTPAEEACQRFTLVLKGHISIATARFPLGTRGVDIDCLARTALWSCGLDYDHGTGHGVGSFLSVHEGPQSISRRSTVALEPGMICSNEPGYYKIGAYGIRIENLCVVTPAEEIAGGDRPMLGFETLTLAPFDRRLIVSSMLTETELHWLNSYHQRVAHVIGPSLDAAEQSWLTSATAPIK